MQNKIYNKVQKHTTKSLYIKNCVCLNESANRKYANKISLKILRKTITVYMILQ